MKICVTGAAGFLGKKLIQTLLREGTLTDNEGHTRSINTIIACDIVPLIDIQDARLHVVSGDMTNPHWLGEQVDTDIDSVFHLAAIVSSQAEAEFDIGMKVNFDATRALMEILRHTRRRPKLVITSSVAVFGGPLPEDVPDTHVWLPQSSYGTQKALNDLLLADYTRKHFINGRSLRMPTIVVRPGKPNKAASSFASSIIREPLNHITTNCPVRKDTPLWLLSPNKAIQALIHIHNLPDAAFEKGRIINMAGLTVTVEEMIHTLSNLAGNQTTAYITYSRDPSIEQIVNSWPGHFTADYAHTLGFTANSNFKEIIEEYITDYMPSPSTVPIFIAPPSI